MDIWLSYTVSAYEQLEKKMEQTHDDIASYNLLGDPVPNFFLSDSAQ